MLSVKRTGRKWWKRETVGILLSFMRKKNLHARVLKKIKEKERRKKNNKERMERINKLNLKSVSPMETK